MRIKTFLITLLVMTLMSSVSLLAKAEDNTAQTESTILERNFL